MTPGEAAYTAWRDMAIAQHLNIHEMADWSELCPHLQATWEAAAKAVIVWFCDTSMDALLPKPEQVSLMCPRCQKAFFADAQDVESAKMEYKILHGTNEIDESRIGMFCGVCVKEIELSN